MIFLNFMVFRFVLKIYTADIFRTEDSLRLNEWVSQQNGKLQRISRNQERPALHGSSVMKAVKARHINCEALSY